MTMEGSGVMPVYDLNNRTAARVVFASACPRHLDTSKIGISLVSAAVANVCLNVWIFLFTPANSHIFNQARRIFP